MLSPRTTWHVKAPVSQPSISQIALNQLYRPCCWPHSLRIALIALTAAPCGFRFKPGFTAEQMGAAMEEAVGWAEQHPAEVRAIVLRATAFAKRFLSRDAVDCYLLQVPLHEARAAVEIADARVGLSACPRRQAQQQATTSSALPLAAVAQSMHREGSLAPVVAKQQGSRRHR